MMLPFLWLLFLLVLIYLMISLPLGLVCTFISPDNQLAPVRELFPSFNSSISTGYSVYTRCLNQDPILDIIQDLGIGSDFNVTSEITDAINGQNFSSIADTLNVE